MSSAVSPEARQVLVSVNPKAGAKSNADLIDQVCSQLAERRFEPHRVTDIDELQTRAETLRTAGQLRAVVAAGGDGTVALVANKTHPDTPLCVLPLGTENLLARYLHLTPSPTELCDVIDAGLTVRLDAGLANGRVFLLMLGCGFDAEVVRRLDESRTGHIHHLSYAKPILDSIRNYQYPEVRVTCDPDAEPQVTTARWAFVVNLPRYAGGLQIVPQANGADGKLDLCTFREGSLWNALRYVTGVFFGQHQSWSDCTTSQATNLRIEADERVPYQVDGDPGGFLPVDVSVQPARLRLVVPESWATTHEMEVERETNANA